MSPLPARPVPFIGDDGQRYMPIRTGTPFAAALLEEWRAHDGKTRRHWLRWSVYNMPLDLYELLEDKARARLTPFQREAAR